MLKRFFILFLFGTIIIPQIIYLSAGTGFPFKKKFVSMEETLEEEGETETGIEERDDDIKEKLFLKTFEIATPDFYTLFQTFPHLTHIFSSEHSRETTTPPPKKA